MCTFLKLLAQIDFITNFFFPAAVAIITYVLIKKLDEWHSRRIYSKLGVIIMETFIEEVETGINLMKDVMDNSKALTAIATLPDKSWEGITTITDEVMLRIIETSKDIAPYHFHPRKIRSHCKNYFINIKSHWDSNISSGPNWRANTHQLLVTNGFYEASENVLLMLKKTKELLQKNSEKKIPR